MEIRHASICPGLGRRVLLLRDQPGQCEGRGIPQGRRLRGLRPDHGRGVVCVPIRVVANYLMPNHLHLISLTVGNRELQTLRVRLRGGLPRSPFCRRWI